MVQHTIPASLLFFRKRLHMHTTINKNTKMYQVAAFIQRMSYDQKNIITIDSLLLFTAADMVLHAGWSIQTAVDYIVMRGGYE